MSIIYNGENLTELLDLVIASKEIPSPTRKEITETVPYMSGEWDFSFLGGEDFYEPVTLKYSFDFIADTKWGLSFARQEAEEKFLLRGDMKFYDTDFAPTNYFKVNRVQTSWSEEGLQGLLTVELKCYPFLLNDISQKIYASSSGEEVTVLNGYSYRPSYVSFAVNGNLTVQHLEHENDDAIAGVYNLTTGSYAAALRAKAYDKLIITGSGSVTISATGELIY